MILQNLKLRNYRNYDNGAYQFEPAIHLITGRNGQGKTNLLESIYYLSTIRTHRNVKDQDLIKTNASSFVISASVKKKHLHQELKAVYSTQGKNLFVHGNAVSKASDFIGVLNAVLFCPDDMMIFQASPRIRRRFIDLELSKMSRSYTKVLSDASRLLKERNAYLKKERKDSTYLSVLTDQLIERQVVIMQQRYRFLKDLQQSSASFYQDLSNDGTVLTLRYESCIPFEENKEVLKQKLKEKYEKAWERDCYLKQTTVGIHKEDFQFYINDKEVSLYASQGQKRSMLLAIKIGLVYMIETIIHEYPVLLLDDVFSELDEVRRKKLLSSLPKDVQIFITATEVDEIPKLSDRQYVKWTVEQGTMSRDS